MTGWEFHGVMLDALVWHHDVFELSVFSSVENGRFLVTVSRDDGLWPTNVDQHITRRDFACESFVEWRLEGGVPATHLISEMELPS